MHAVPTMFIAMLEYGDFARFDLSRLRTGVMAGSPCPIEVMRSVMSRMHLHEMTIAYGMTETAPISFQSSIDDPVERRVSFVGRVQPHLEVKIVDSAGEMVPRGTAGELLTRGYSVMLGYWGDEEKTREAVDSEGWMHTGDLATLDAEGFCNIVGRSKDMVIRGGENIFPREIEEFLYRPPEGPGCAGNWCAGCKIWRGGLCLHHSAAGCGVDRCRDPRFLPRQDRALQGSAVCAVHGGIPHDGDRKDPEIPAASADGGRAGLAGGGHGLNMMARATKARSPSALNWD